MCNSDTGRSRGGWAGGLVSSGRVSDQIAVGLRLGPCGRSRGGCMGGCDVQERNRPKSWWSDGWRSGRESVPLSDWPRSTSGLTQTAEVVLDALTAVMGSTGTGRSRCGVKVGGLAAHGWLAVATKRWETSGTGSSWSTDFKTRQGPFQLCNAFLGDLGSPEIQRAELSQAMKILKASVGDRSARHGEHL